MLFNPTTSKALYNFDARPQKDGSYICGGMVYKCGLLWRSLDFHSIESPIVNIPLAKFGLFLVSNHPTICAATFPKPRELVFEEGESVRIYNHVPQVGMKGLVTVVHIDFLELDFGEEGGGNGHCLAQCAEDCQHLFASLISSKRKEKLVLILVTI